jgi:uncharacterized protein YqhQ
LIKTIQASSASAQGAACPERLPTYGGQALIEGVMMRGSRAVAAAMRAPDGEIVVHTERLSGIYKSKWIKVPFVRGLVALWDALGLGMRFLTMSANLQGGEDEKIEGKELYLTLAASLLIAIGLFFATPAFLGYLGERFLGLSGFAGNLLEGLIRLGAIIGYITLVGRIPEIGRVFAYHGAEHKTINAYEARSELNPKSVLGFSLEHPRCGTAFLLTLVLFSIIFFSLMGPMPPLVRILTRILFIPVLAGVAYEYIRWTARHLDNPIVKVLVRPNLALQRLTTREPDAGMAEVSITAFNAMLEMEQALIQEEGGQPVEIETERDVLPVEKEPAALP